MSTGNSIDRRDYELAASQTAQENFNAVASRLEALIDARDRDVKTAMADYLADGVSEDYAAKEARWNRVAERGAHHHPHPARLAGEERHHRPGHPQEGQGRRRRDRLTR